MIEFDEELITICEIDDESEREDTLDDSIDEIILEIRGDVEDTLDDFIDVIVPDMIDDVEDSIESDKIPSWVHDIFVLYANETISENELLLTIEYLISQGTINVNSN